ncbi:hypothetical protein TNIN_197361 [Trichonephila inaurata madagascariensis]|uniref:Uncharacterized protein n=1 Tax=Trichonephila inaurata madagascariensis TaxID=2747483 RepID=A0A8X6YBJ2_9ARAC|nr:hypothetical protein TNIN_197361 [Trichonephila inaurata madagascariensis]
MSSFTQLVHLVAAHNKAAADAACLGVNVMCAFYVFSAVDTRLKDVKINWIDFRKISSGRLQCIYKYYFIASAPFSSYSMCKPFHPLVVKKSVPPAVDQYGMETLRDDLQRPSVCLLRARMSIVKKSVPPAVDQYGMEIPTDDQFNHQYAFTSAQGCVKFHAIGVHLQGVHNKAYLRSLFSPAVGSIWDGDTQRRPATISMFTSRKDVKFHAIGTRAARSQQGSQ